MIIQLNPTIPVWTEKGNGQAFLVIDYSQEHHLLFTIALDSNGEIWTLPSYKIRFQFNESLGRLNIAEKP